MTVRLHLFAEGQTEQAFARQVLAPHLAGHGVYLHNPVLIAHKKRRGRVHRGGGRNFRVMQNDIQRRLRQERAADVFFTSMVDLYALPGDFPGRETAEDLRHVPRERVQSLEEVWSDAAGDPRFLPYLQLHEFEACLFTDIGELCGICEANRAEEPLRRIADQYESPELIDDGAQTAPSKRIEQHIPAYPDLKVTVGPEAAARIGLAAIRAACPHFGKWLTRLEQLGRP